MAGYDTRVEARNLLIARLSDENGNKGKVVTFAERENDKPISGMGQPQKILVALIDGQEACQQVFVPLAVNSEGALNSVAL